MAKKKITEEEFNSSIHVKEYKRKCNQCGKVWHSLASREKKIKGDIKTDNFQVCANPCHPSAQLQARRNVEASQSQLEKIKSCPKCGSQDYTEEVIIYEKQ